MFRYKYKKLFLFRLIKGNYNCNLDITIFYYGIDFIDKEKIPH